MFPTRTPRVVRIVWIVYHALPCFPAR
ncbi:MAG: hypothetical protein ACYC6M_12205 [Terriglobales bacterium]